MTYWLILAGFAGFVAGVIFCFAIVMWGLTRD